MENLREQFNKADREQLQADISSLRPLILPLLLKRQGNSCFRCNEEVDKYDIHHTVYNPKVTLNELQALCIACHKAITDFRPLRNR